MLVSGALGEIRTHTARVLKPPYVAFAANGCVGCSSNPQLEALDAASSARLVWMCCVPAAYRALMGLRLSPDAATVKTLKGETARQPGPPGTSGVHGRLLAERDR